MIKTAKFMGKRHEFDFRKPMGACDPPQGRPPTIEIPGGFDDKKSTLDTYVHEMLHACFFDMPESKVERAARDITDALWRAGYRLKGE